MSLCNVDTNHHFWEPHSEVCQCGKLVWELDPLAWPKLKEDEELAGPELLEEMDSD